LRLEGTRNGSILNPFFIAVESEIEQIQSGHNGRRLSADFPGLRGIWRLVVAL
jgi:hypothetical protein